MAFYPAADYAKNTQNTDNDLAGDTTIANAQDYNRHDDELEAIVSDLRAGLAKLGSATFEDHGDKVTILTGRSGGQTIQGGTGASENLTLESTSHGTKGSIIAKDKLIVQSSSGIEIGTNSVTGLAVIKGAAASIRRLRYQSGGSPRWDVLTEDTAEGGSDAGSDFEIRAYDDGGSSIDTPFKIERASTGAVTISRKVRLTDTTDATDATGATGSLGTLGGMSVAKALYVGGSVVLTDGESVTNSNTGHWVNLAGGNGFGDGASIGAYGSTHPSHANRIRFFVGSTEYARLTSTQLSVDQIGELTASAGVTIADDATFGGSVTIGDGTGTDYLTVDVSGTDQNLAVFQADLGTNDRNFIIKSPTSDSASEPFRFTTSNAFAFEVDGTQRLLIDASGTIGVSQLTSGDGTGTATIKVDAGGTSEVLLELRADLGTNDRNMTISSPSSDSTTAPFEFGTSNSFDFLIDGTSRLLIDDSGTLNFGTHAALSGETVTGYITIKDQGGTARKLAVVS